MSTLEINFFYGGAGRKYEDGRRIRHLLTSPESGMLIL